MQKFNKQYEIAYATIRKDINKSIKMYQELLKIDSYYQNGLHDLTMLYAFQENYDLALKQAKVYLNKYPGDFRVFNCLGYICYRQKHYEKAITYFEEVIFMNFSIKFIFPLTFENLPFLTSPLISTGLLLKNLEQSIGTTVMATPKEASSEKVTVKDNSLNKIAVKPSTNTTGRNTATVVIVEAKIAAVTS